MIRRAIVAAVLVGVAAVVAAPAQAEPTQVCVAYSSDRRGICVEIGDQLPGR